MNDHAHRTAVLHVAAQASDIQHALAAAQGLIDTHPDTLVRIIVHGDALAGVTHDADPITVPDGVTVEACERGLSRRNISLETIQRPVSTVPSALVEIIAAQWAGAAYARM